MPGVRGRQERVDVAGQGPFEDVGGDVGLKHLGDDLDQRAVLEDAVAASLGGKPKTGHEG